MSHPDSLDAAGLLDWRRRIAELYREIRRTPDPRAGHDLWRSTRDELFAHHPQTPLPESRRRTFSGLTVGSYDAALRFVVDIDTDVEPLHLNLATSTEGTVPFQRAGVVHLPDVGQLDVWWMTSYGGGIFVPIKDGLAGTRTYGGGRYLLDTVKGADLGGDNGTLVIDLNFAYNPSCAYDPRWTCPLAPRGNTVAYEVSAGEMQ